MAKDEGENTLPGHSATSEVREAVNPPVVRASTVTFGSLAELRKAAAAPFDGFFYGRFGTPTHAALSAALRELSGAHGAVFFPSGLAAISACLSAFTSPGDHLLVVDCVYEPTRKFCDEELARRGVEVSYFAPDCGADIEHLINDRTRLILCESPGSLTMEVQDIPAICAAARAAGDVLVAVDNTWATPLLCPVLHRGADIDLQSATKYLAGHADLMLGVALCNERAHVHLRRSAAHYGQCVSADDAWLTLRGMRTLQVRLARHADSAQQVIAYLRNQPEVLEVLSPGLTKSDAQVFERDYRGGNGLFSMELVDMPDERLARFTDALRLFRLGFSWGGFESLCLPFDPAPVRSHGNWSAGGRFVRLHVGLEEPADLIADLKGGFAALRA